MKLILTSSLLALLFTACSREEAPVETTTVPAETTAAPAEDYPLEVCVVSGEELGSMGEPVTIVHEGRTVKFCCDACLPKFEENPDEYLSKLED